MAKKETQLTPRDEITQPAEDGQKIMVGGQEFVVRKLPQAIPPAGGVRLRTGKPAPKYEFNS